LYGHFKCVGFNGLGLPTLQKALPLQMSVRRLATLDEKCPQYLLVFNKHSVLSPGYKIIKKQK